MINSFKKILFYSVRGISLITFVNVVILLQFPITLPLSSISIVKLMYIAWFDDLGWLSILSISMCVFIFFAAKSFCREKIILPVMLFAYFLYESIFLINNLLRLLNENKFSLEQCIGLAIDVIVIVLMIIYFVLCIKEKHKLKVEKAENLDLLDEN